MDPIDLNLTLRIVSLKTVIQMIEQQAPLLEELDDFRSLHELQRLHKQLIERLKTTGKIPAEPREFILKQCKSLQSINEIAGKLINPLFRVGDSILTLRAASHASITPPQAFSLNFLNGLKRKTTLWSEEIVDLRQTLRETITRNASSEHSSSSIIQTRAITLDPVVKELKDNTTTRSLFLAVSELLGEEKTTLGVLLGEDRIVGYWHLDDLISFCDADGPIETSLQNHMSQIAISADNAIISWHQEAELLQTIQQVASDGNISTAETQSSQLRRCFVDLPYDQLEEITRRFASFNDSISLAYSQIQTTVSELRKSLRRTPFELLDQKTILTLEEHINEIEQEISKSKEHFVGALDKWRDSEFYQQAMQHIDGETRRLETQLNSIHKKMARSRKLKSKELTILWTIVILVLTVLLVIWLSQ